MASRNKLFRKIKEKLVVEGEADDLAATMAKSAVADRMGGNRFLRIRYISSFWA